MKRNDPAEAERWVNVQWAATPQTAMQTGIEVIATDRVGLVYDITGVLMESKIPIIHSASRNLKMAMPCLKRRSPLPARSSCGI